MQVPLVDKQFTALAGGSRSAQTPELAEDGYLQPALCVVILLVAFAGFSFWGFFRNWNFLMQTQLRLDRCVGEAAQDWRDTLNSLVFTNHRIFELRAAIQAANAAPYLIPPLEAALTAIVFQQEWKQNRWNIQAGKWLIRQGCGHRGDWAAPLPALKFVRDPPDSLGPQALQWEGEMPSEFQFSLIHRPRKAAAQVEGGSDGSYLNTKRWKAAWAVPQVFKGAGTH